MDINNINIELTGEQAIYKCPLNTIYTAEFDYNFKILVCHTYNEPVLTSFMGFIHSSLNDMADNAIRQAINNSSTITLDIIYIQRLENAIGYSSTGIFNALIEQKFNFIYSLKAYAPYGLNNLNYIIEHGRFKEKAYARKLIKELNKENPSSKVKGPKPVPIYKYDMKTGVLLEAFNSISEAAKATEISVGSIYQCLAGRSKTAGNYAWSKTKKSKINTETSDKIEALKERTEKNLQVYNKYVNNQNNN